MLRKYCSETGNEWDEGVPLLLFAIRETIQESLKFSLSELVFGHTVRGPLKVHSLHSRLKLLSFFQCIYNVIIHFPL